jgi:hypothetical protein
MTVNSTSVDRNEAPQPEVHQKRRPLHCGALQAPVNFLCEPQIMLPSLEAIFLELLVATFLAIQHHLHRQANTKLN